jgi:predicted amidophosphoribosyltransferase
LPPVRHRGGPKRGLRLRRDGRRIAMAEGREHPRRRKRARSAVSEDDLRRSLDVFRKFVVECHACQTEAPPYWQYCTECGTRLATRCPGCGSPLPPVGARYCPHCGIAIPPEGERT